MLECLTNIVGVLKEATPVITAGMTAGEIAELQKSTSGLFLDELPGGVHMKALKFSDVTKPFASMAENSIELANKNLEADLILAIRERYSKSRNNFKGQLGQLSYATTLQVSKRFQYVRLKPLDFIDGVITVNKFNAIFNQTGNIIIYLLEVPADTVTGVEIKSFPLSVTANQFKTVELTGENVLNLQMIKGGELMEYWFVYDLLELGYGAAPKDMKLSCRTCGGQAIVSDFVEITGGEMDSMADLTYKSIDNYAHGLVLDVSILCNTGGIFCKEYDNQEAVAVTMAYAVWYRAGELLIEEVLKAPDVNRFTTQGREYLWGKRNHFRKEYEDRLRYLSAVINVQQSNCYVCREITNMPNKSGILA